jgi:hypothetical protein
VPLLFKPTAKHLKTALMSYFRYKRQFVAGDEVRDCDVVAIDKKQMVYDIEVKISKSDLWQGEAKKGKHKNYVEHTGKWFTPNFFYVCVPTELVEEAEKWVTKTNKNYGVIEFITNIYPNKTSRRFWEELVVIRRRAKPLTDNIKAKWSEALVRRLSSALTTRYQELCYVIDARKGIK